MNTEQKRYVLVFTGLFLMIVGGILFLKSLNRSAIDSEKFKVKAYIVANKVEKPENIFVPFNRPTKLNYIYDEGKEFKRDIPMTMGLKKYVGDKYLDDYRIVCAGKNCSRQVLTSQESFVLKNKNISPKTLLVKGDIVFSKGHLDYLKSNTCILGDVYIKDIDFLKIPKNFKVLGNIYLVNADGVTFMGDNLVDGHIYLSGKSSVRAFPKSVKLTGQIFI